jgi:hypothetical protein
MDATPPARPDDGGTAGLTPAPSGAGGDFVVVEDSGEFSYYRSGGELLADLVAGLFETLQLERGTDAELGLWGLEIDGLSTRRSALADVDRLLAGNERLDTVRVTDPFGHLYRPVWHPKHRHLGHAGFLIYVETPARAGTSRR